MVDKIDGYQSLGGADKIKWGRDVSTGVVDNRKETNRLRQDFENTTASNRTTTNALSEQILIIAQTQEELRIQQEALEAQQLLLESQQDSIEIQQAYLNSLTTNSISGPDVSSNDVSGALVVSGQTDPALTFTLPQDLKCKITLRGTARLAVSWASTTTFANVSIITGVRMDGALYGGGQGSAYLSFGPNGVNGNVASRALIEAQVIVDITAGTHTASSYFSFQGNGASANMVVDNPTLTVEVIGLP